MFDFDSTKPVNSDADVESGESSNDEDAVKAVKRLRPNPKKELNEKKVCL